MSLRFTSTKVHVVVGLTVILVVVCSQTALAGEDNKIAYYIKGCYA